MARATSVSEAAAVCDPDLPVEANHDWYVDLSPHRGANVVEEIRRTIRRKEEAVDKGLLPEEQRYAKLLLTGLRGSGKTTELMQLAGLLEGEGYYPVLLSGVQELNLEQLSVIELLMSFLWVLQDAQARADHPRFRIEVPAQADQELNLALASVLVEERDRTRAELKLESEFGVEARMPFFLKVKVALKSILAASTERARTVKAEIVPRTSTFTTTLRQVLGEVQSSLRDQGSRGLVFLVDELDRLSPRATEEFPQLTIPEMLFSFRAAELKTPPAHVIYTFPSQLLVRVALGRSWPDKPLIIPAVKLTDRDRRTRHDPGVAALRDLVAARVEVDRVFAAPALLDELVEFSGGYARDLVRLVRYAANRTDTLIGPAETRGARRDLVNEYDRLIAPSLVDLLVEVDRSRRLPPEPRYSELLERNLVLTYWNDEEWADLHPAVRQARGYRGALTP